MITSYAHAVDEILETLRAVLTDLPVGWPNMPIEPPTDGSTWARVAIRHSTGGPASLGAPGRRLWANTGTLYVQIFTRTGVGPGPGAAVAKVVADALRAGRTPSGVLFTNVAPVEAGTESGWDQVIVTARFEYEEIV